MALPILHAHPLSSCCQKVLIAARVLGVALDERMVNLGDPGDREMLQAISPAGKMPVLVDHGRAVAETSIIIEYLQQLAAGARLIPADADAALAVRFWDRFSDFYVMTPMQALTAERLKPESGRSEDVAQAARSRLLESYAAMNRQLEDRTWLAGEGFSMADCAAAPALFYAVAYVPIPGNAVHLLDYLERLMAHPAVAAVVDAARPWFKYFPGRAGLSARFYTPEA
jgi:glutathione S-transferase